MQDVPGLTRIWRLVPNIFDRRLFAGYCECVSMFWNHSSLYSCLSKKARPVRIMRSFPLLSVAYPTEAVMGVLTRSFSLNYHENPAPLDQWFGWSSSSVLLCASLRRFSVLSWEAIESGDASWLTVFMLTSWFGWMLRSLFFVCYSVFGFNWRFPLENGRITALKILAHKLSSPDLRCRIFVFFG